MGESDPGSCKPVVWTFATEEFGESRVHAPHGRGEDVTKKARRFRWAGAFRPMLLASLPALVAAFASAQDVASAELSNARPKLYGGTGTEWECDHGLRRDGERCVPVEVPENAHLTTSGNDWDCDSGYRRSGGTCATSDR